MNKTTAHNSNLEMFREQVIADAGRLFQLEVTEMCLSMDRWVVLVSVCMRPHTAAFTVLDNKQVMTGQCDSLTRI